MKLAALHLLAMRLARVHGHMIMKTPIPFDQENLSNSPLDSQGRDFPCKNPNYSHITTTNNFALGSNQTLSFIGTSVHGGGSCQVSLTYDTPPRNDSTWKVIHSIQGGCPARCTSGNLGAGDASQADPFEYSFPVPADLPAGPAVVAWTWLNKRGGRGEFYMNCAPANLTGAAGGSSTAAYDRLPDLFVANMPAINTCRSTMGCDTIYPNAGASVENNTAPDAPDARVPPPCVGRYTGGAGAEAADAPAPGGPASSQPSAPTPVSGVFATYVPEAWPPSRGPRPACSRTRARPPAPSGTASAPSGTAPASLALAASGAPHANATVRSGGPCAPEGAWVCRGGGAAWQRCASGRWSPVRPLAAGTACRGGDGGFSVVAAADNQA